MANLFSEILKREELNEKDIKRMFVLFQQYYASITFSVFKKDLEAKNYIVLLREKLTNIIMGFSTLHHHLDKYQDNDFAVIFSGDTIIHHDFWGEQGLQQAWLELAGRLKQQHPNIPLYWFLITKGHRTYRYMSLFSKVFYPSWRHQTPEEISDFKNYLASTKYPEDYDASSGVIKFSHASVYLKPQYTEASEIQNNKPDIKFFVEKNPGYTKGDELVCLTELSKENLQPRACRSFLRGINFHNQ